MQRLISPTLGLAALALAAGVAEAHHGWGSYDAEKPLTLDGVIRTANFENPHGMIKVEAAGKTWDVVLAPPFRMQNRGLPADALKVGERAVVVGYPHKSEQNEMRAERITVGGKTTELR